MPVAPGVSRALTVALLGGLAVFAVHSSAASTGPQPARDQDAAVFTVSGGDCVLYDVEGTAVCDMARDAMPADRGDLEVIYKGRQDGGTGLTLVLRATNQLNANAQAKAAYTRA